MSTFELKTFIKKIVLMYYQYFKVAIVTTYDGPLIKFLKFLSPANFFIVLCRKKNKKTRNISNVHK